MKFKIVSLGFIGSLIWLVMTPLIMAVVYLWFSQWIVPALVGSVWMVIGFRSLWKGVVKVIEVKI